MRAGLSTLFCLVALIAPSFFGGVAAVYYKLTGGGPGVGSEWSFNDGTTSTTTAENLVQLTLRGGTSGTWGTPPVVCYRRVSGVGFSFAQHQALRWTTIPLAQYDACISESSPADDAACNAAIGGSCSVSTCGGGADECENESDCTTEQGGVWTSYEDYCHFAAGTANQCTFTNIPKTVIDACEAKQDPATEADCDAAVAGFGANQEYTRHCGIKFTSEGDNEDATHTASCEQTYSVKEINMDFVRPGRGYIAPKILHHRRRGEVGGCSPTAECDGVAVSDRDALFTPCQSAETLTDCFDADVTVSTDKGEVIAIEVTNGGEYRPSKSGSIDQSDTAHKFINIRSTAGACGSKHTHFCSVSTCGPSDNGSCVTEAECVAEASGVWAPTVEKTRATCLTSGKTWHAGIEGVCAQISHNDANVCSVSTCGQNNDDGCDTKAECENESGGVWAPSVLKEVVFNHGATSDIAAIALSHKRLLVCFRKQSNEGVSPAEDRAECRLLDFGSNSPLLDRGGWTDELFVQNWRTNKIQGQDFDTAASISPSGGLGNWEALGGGTYTRVENIGGGNDPPFTTSAALRIEADALVDGFSGAKFSPDSTLMNTNPHTIKMWAKATCGDWYIAAGPSTCAGNPATKCGEDSDCINTVAFTATGAADNENSEWTLTADAAVGAVLPVGSVVTQAATRATATIKTEAAADATTVEVDNVSGTFEPNNSAFPIWVTVTGDTCSGTFDAELGPLPVGAVWSVVTLSWTPTAAGNYDIYIMKKGRRCSVATCGADDDEKCGNKADCENENNGAWDPHVGNCDINVMESCSRKGIFTGTEMSAECKFMCTEDNSQGCETDSDCTANSGADTCKALSTSHQVCRHGCYPDTYGIVVDAIEIIEDDAAAPVPAAGTSVGDISLSLIASSTSGADTKALVCYRDGGNGDLGTCKTVWFRNGDNASPDMNANVVVSKPIVFNDGCVEFDKDLAPRSPSFTRARHIPWKCTAPGDASDAVRYACAHACTTRRWKGNHDEFPLDIVGVQGGPRCTPQDDCDSDDGCTWTHVLPGNVPCTLGPDSTNMADSECRAGEWCTTSQLAGRNYCRASREYIDETTGVKHASNRNFGEKACKERRWEPLAFPHIPGHPTYGANHTVGHPDCIWEPDWSTNQRDPQHRCSWAGYGTRSTFALDVDGSTVAGSGGDADRAGGLLDSAHERQRGHGLVSHGLLSAGDSHSYSVICYRDPVTGTHGFCGMLKHHFFVGRCSGAAEAAPCAEDADCTDANSECLLFGTPTSTLEKFGEIHLFNQGCGYGSNNYDETCLHRNSVCDTSQTGARSNWGGWADSSTGRCTTGSGAKTYDISVSTDMNDHPTSNDPSASGIVCWRNPFNTFDGAAPAELRSDGTRGDALTPEGMDTGGVYCRRLVANEDGRLDIGGYHKIAPSGTHPHFFAMWPDLSDNTIVEDKHVSGAVCYLSHDMDHGYPWQITNNMVSFPFGYTDKSLVCNVIKVDEEPAGMPLYLRRGRTGLNFVVRESTDNEQEEIVDVATIMASTKPPSPGWNMEWLCYTRTVVPSGIDAAVGGSCSSTHSQVCEGSGCSGDETCGMNPTLTSACVPIGKLDACQECQGQGGSQTCSTIKCLESCALQGLGNQHVSDRENPEKCMYSGAEFDGFGWGEFPTPPVKILQNTISD